MDEKPPIIAKVFFCQQISCVVSLAATLAVPFCTGDFLFFGRDENAELLRKMSLPKKPKKTI